jgi:hypothetical protein
MEKIGRVLLGWWLAVVLAGCNAVQTALPTRAVATSTTTSGLAGTSSIVPAMPTITSPAVMSTATLGLGATSIWTPFPTLTPTTKLPLAPTLTVTPYPPLAVTGPYLVYIVKLPDGRQAVRMLDANDSGRKTIPLLEGAHVEYVPDSLSPDGEWLAFYTGSVEQEPYDLRLNLIHLPDGEVYTVTQLLSDDYPNNFETIAENIKQNDPDAYGYLTIDELAQGIRGLFQEGIYSVGWSPDGRYLAFAGQMEGLSSDIYRYDVQSKTILRLTDGPEQINSLYWSPDGKWILHEACNHPMNPGWAPNLYAARFDGGQTKKLFEYFPLWGWLSATTYAVYHNENGPGRYDLRFVNIETDQTVFYWPDSFEAFVIDPQFNIIAIDGMPWKNQDLIIGTYLIYPSGSKKLVLEGFHNRLAFRGGEIHRFVGVDFALGTYGIDSNGSVTKISEASGNIDIAPNYQWMLMFSVYPDDLQNIDLYSKSDEFVRHISDDYPERIIWRPDSQAIFYRVGTALYYVALPDGQPTLVDNNILTFDWGIGGDYGFAWTK